MTQKEEIRDLVQKNRMAFPRMIERKYPTLFQEMSKLPGIKFSEKVYLWLNDLVTAPLCAHCKEKPVGFVDMNQGFSVYCSRNCASKHNNVPSATKNLKFWHETNCAICNTPFWSLIKREQKTCSGKCSGILVAQDPERMNKIRATKLAKYGNETYVNPEKGKATCLAKYGVDNASKSVEVIEKIRTANQKKYGVDWMFQAEEVKEKTKESNLANHGVAHVSQRLDVKQKKIDTSQKEFGVDNPFQSKKVQDEIKKTMFEKYGVEYPSQSKEINEIGLEKKRKEYYHKLKNMEKFTKEYEILFLEDDYVKRGNTHKYPFECRKCKTKFEDFLIYGEPGHPRCLKCNPLQLIGTSLSEQEIAAYVKSLTTDPVIENSRSILPSGLELDIYIPSKKLAIEFNGLYWHSELAGKSKTYHLDKVLECEKQSIHLLQIFEDEWKNKQEIVKQKIRSKLISGEKRIGGRELIIMDIDSKKKNAFLDKYHIQGKDMGSYCYGAYLKDELVAVCTFSKPRLALGNKNKHWDNEYELSRFATSKPLVGVLSKFLRHFQRAIKPKKIISFADRRFTNSTKNIYLSSGFTLINNTPPNYWYFQNGYYNRWHRFSFRKSELSKKLAVFDANKSEWQNMVDNDYNRIWDCGNLKYELVF